MSGRETARGRTTADERLRRRGLRLAYFIIVWDLIEGAVAITAGRLAGSAALLGFGIDSGIEVFAGAITAWQLHGGGRRRAPALRLIAVSFLALAAYVTYDAGSDLLTGERPDASLVGIGLNVVALAVMIPVALLQQRTGRALGNEVLTAQSRETWISNYLSVSLLAGGRTPRSGGGGPIRWPPSPSREWPRTPARRPGARQVRSSAVLRAPG